MTIIVGEQFGPKNLGLSVEEVAKRVKTAIEMVGLDYEAVKDRAPFELSGGQKRRVAIAGIIAMQPKMLILDEPTAGLDPFGKEQIRRLLPQYRQKADIRDIERPCPHCFSKPQALLMKKKRWKI